MVAIAPEKEILVTEVNLEAEHVYMQITKAHN